MPNASLVPSELLNRVVDYFHPADIVPTLQSVAHAVIALFA